MGDRGEVPKPPLANWNHREIATLCQRPARPAHDTVSSRPTARGPSRVRVVEESGWDWSGVADASRGGLTSRAWGGGRLWARSAKKAKTWRRRAVLDSRCTAAAERARTLLLHGYLVGICCLCMFSLDQLHAPATIRECRETDEVERSSADRATDAQSAAPPRFSERRFFCPRSSGSPSPHQSMPMATLSLFDTVLTSA